jgi:hypothetical protein
MAWGEDQSHGAGSRAGHRLSTGDTPKVVVHQRFPAGVDCQTRLLGFSYDVFDDDRTDRVHRS